MINITTQNNNINFKSNTKLDYVRKIGHFFEEEVKNGSLVEFKSDLVNNLAKRASIGSKKPPYVMSLTGYSGSGKTFFNNLALKVLGEDKFSMITGDNTYKDLSNVFQENGGFAGLINKGYDLQGPHNFDLDISAKKISDLRKGKDIFLNKYLMDDTGRVEPNGYEVKAAPFMLFDGISAVFSPLKEAFDSRAFLKVSDEILKKRFFERNRNIDDAAVFKQAIAGGKKYIGAEVPNMDLTINGEAKPDEMKKFINEFFNIIK